MCLGSCASGLGAAFKKLDKKLGFGGRDPEFLISFCLVVANSSTCSPKSRGWISYSMFSYSVLALYLKDHGT